MIRGLYTAASGMLAMQRRQEALANNLANVNTPGYKADEGVLRAFPEQLLSRIRDPEGPTVDGLPNFTGQPVPIGTLHTGVYMSEALPIFTQGDIIETKNPYDLALMDNLPPVEGEDGRPVKRSLFFGIARMDDPAQPLTDPAQIRYTRNGNFNVNADGYLVTPDGYYVLDNQNRAIRLNDPQGISTGDRVVFNERGELFLPGPAGLDEADPTQQLGYSLGLKLVTDPNQLIREGNNVFRWGGQGQPADLDPYDPAVQGFFGVKQGWVERSNVDSTKTMTDMMAVLRAYEANQRVITTLDGTLDKAVNEVGRVNG